jgi:2-aminoadipate transaminase
MMQTPNGLSQRAYWAGGEPIASVLMDKTLARPDLVSLAAGFVDSETLPVEATRLAAEAILSDPQKARMSLQYGSTIDMLRSARRCSIAHFRQTGARPRS